MNSPETQATLGTWQNTTHETEKMSKTHKESDVNSRACNESAIPVSEKDMPRYSFSNPVKSCGSG